ncbi:MAG TPA: gliding motility-associated ABC transporter ATP-binding subunit GldA [Puia sp.]|nr:gliding motility-associated ABC transporter ATP-binding subunit GldA [Puia sp.]
MSIEVKDLVKVYGEQKAVDTISFSVGKGEIVGFLGPNGAGKSTTMKILTGYLGQDSGEAYVCGISVRDRPLETKKKIGYLPEANPLYPDMYVREYLDFIADIHHTPDKRQRMEAVITLVGLTVESNKKLGQLSKGYKQRVGLAAALLHEPEVLILDEPTSGLDPNQIIEIRDVIRRLGKDKTILFSSHILQEVEALCDRVIIINRGKLVADSPLSQLRAQNTGSNAIKVVFRDSPEPTALEQLAQVSAVARMPDGHWVLQTAAPDEVKKQLMELALQNNWNIVSLQSGNQSLEDIFRQLTIN